ncbi:MAG: Na+/H+ antiporter [Chitinophagaceae bacterium]|nr:Na+/H+ antiporter [Chitinophagaceae bacterium]
MIHENLLLVLSLLFAIFILIMLGQRLNISYPIFLVIGGLLISLIPGIPAFEIDPQIVFLIFLPPLLYEAAWYTSWRDFWRMRRAIALLGFGLVLFTSFVIAFLSHSIIPGFTLALGFLLGGIISPPDAVAATSVLKGLAIPKRVLTILEGESLVNDAASLTVFRFALAAVVSGSFVMKQAAAEFFMITFMGIVIGLAVAHVFYVLHRWFPTNSSMDAALTFMAPYFMYLSAEHFHYSGVMAVVSGGLFLSYRAHEIFKFNSRLQIYGVWNTITFVLNGFVFILIGLQLPVIVNGLGDYSLAQAIKYGLIITLATILVRIVWVYPATFIPRWLSKRVRQRESLPSIANVFIVAWAGMRGVVSLASALAVPLTLSTGKAFPQRNLILFITFVVILVTLVVQGLTLPFLIRQLELQDSEDSVPEDEQETAVSLALTQTALQHINQKYSREMAGNELVQNLGKQLESEQAITSQLLESLECDTLEKQEIDIYHRILLDINRMQRKELSRIRREHKYSDEVIRKKEAWLDMEEARLH